MLVGSGDQAPRPSRLVGLPIKWRPLFPTTAYTYTITNPDVLTAVAKSSRVRFLARANGHAVGVLWDGYNNTQECSCGFSNFASQQFTLG